MFAVLTGLAISLPLTAWSASRNAEDTSFPAIMRFGIMPMFLFAGAFFPIGQLPGWLQVAATVTPLYHGVELARGAVLGTLTASSAAGHIAVLVAFAACRLRHQPPLLRQALDDMTVAAFGGLRIVPLELLRSRRAGRMIERSLLVVRRQPIVYISGFFEPLFYLLSIRIGFTALVGDIEVRGQPVEYAAFVAPALMASSAMNGAVYDSR